jgi:hypothetical protein
MGQKQAAFDTAGAVLAFYDTDDSPAPAGVQAVDISDDLWSTLLAAQAGGKSLVRGADGMPMAVDPPPPSADEIKAINSNTRDGLLASATLAIAPLQDAVDLDEATDAEAALLKQWKQYRIAVNRVDLTQADPAWPTAPTGT